MYRDPIGGARFIVAVGGSMVAVFGGSYLVGYYGEYLLAALVPVGAALWLLRRRRRSGGDHR
jgi:hypothetical protein